MSQLSEMLTLALIYQPTVSCLVFLKFFFKKNKSYSEWAIQHKLNGDEANSRPA